MSESARADATARADVAAGAAAARRQPARPVRVAVVDYGAGNLVSIGQALAAVGATVSLATSPDGLEGANALVVPGVGAAGAAMRRLRRAGLLEPVREWAASGRPYLGICLGLQLLFERSEEDGEPTFGLLPGRTVALRDAPTLPHIGWNQVERRRESGVFAGIPNGAEFYFVHSFAPAPADDSLILAETTHGRPFVSAVGRGNLLGLQFHPERSAGHGLRLLANFVAGLAETTRLDDAPRLAAAAPAAGPC